MEKSLHKNLTSFNQSEVKLYFIKKNIRNIDMIKNITQVVILLYKKGCCFIMFYYLEVGLRYDNDTSDLNGKSR